MHRIVSNLTGKYSSNPSLSFLLRIAEASTLRPEIFTTPLLSISPPAPSFTNPDEDKLT